MKKYFILLISLFLLINCKKPPVEQTSNTPTKSIEKQHFVKSDVQINFDSLPYKTISQYGFFKDDIKKLSPNSGVLPYDLISPLFTDYASKKRFAYMPKGKQASIEKDDEVLNFPDETVLIKNFYYPKETYRDQYIVETRLLIKYNGEWKAYPYLWNEEQTEAKYKPTGAILPITFNNNAGEKTTINYAVPNKNQCKNCHNIDSEIKPIGPKPMHLNKLFDYSKNTIENQLQAWSTQGYISNYDSQTAYQKIAKWDDSNESLNSRARSYLDINCAHCHNSKGSANTSGLFLTYNEKELSRLGFCKTPVATGRGSGGHQYDIVPGNAEKSILSYRMNSLEPDIMMPEIGRISIHKEGLELINEWIETLEGDCN